MPIGWKYAASSRISVVPSCTSASAPPMIPAIACGAPLGVADEQVVGRERPLDAVERRHPLAASASRTTRPRPGEPVEVERVQRLAPLEQHVVRDVDDVRDRPHPGEHEPPRHPGGRLPHRHPDAPSREPRAAIGRLDRDGDVGRGRCARFVDDRLRARSDGNPKYAARSRATPTIDIASGRFGVIVRSNTTSCRSRTSRTSAPSSVAGVQPEDPAVVVAEPELARRAAASRPRRSPRILRRSSVKPPGSVAPDRRVRHDHAGVDVRRAADDRRRARRRSRCRRAGACRRPGAAGPRAPCAPPSPR